MSDIKAMIAAGQLSECIREAQAQVRSNPAEAKHRVLLFQLMALTGEWQKALTQLNVAADLDAGCLLMAQACRAALACQGQRDAVFAAKTSPLIFGEPAEWIGWLFEANRLQTAGKSEPAQSLRQRAFDAAPAVSGTINGQPFEWIADADQRLGPVLEAIIDGRYFWIPFDRIRQIDIDRPADLRDLVWAPARFIWSNGGTAVGFIPTRYPGSERAADPALVLARRTDWPEAADGEPSAGIGQRLLATDQAEFPLLEIRQITLNIPLVESAADGPSAQGASGG